MSKKILQISPYWFEHPGGVEQYAKILQEIFPEKIITFAWWVDFPIIEPITHFPLPKFWKNWFFQIFKNIKKENTEAIISHIRFAPTSWLAFFLARKKWIPYIHIEHGTGFLVHKNPLIALIAKIVDLTISNYIMRNADQVICISQAWKKWVSETFWIKTEDIKVIYRWFEFPKIERKKNTIPKIGFVGRLTGLKNVQGLIETLPNIQNEKWILEIVGDGEERKNLENLIGKLWLTERIIFLGSRSHDWIMNEFYPSIDIFINPSLQEWLPTTVIEALWMGCQVIATDVWGTNEIANITLVPPHNPKMLNEKIHEKLHTKNTPIRFGIEFSVEKMKNKFTLIFSKTV